MQFLRLYHREMNTNARLNSTALCIVTPGIHTINRRYNSLYACERHVTTSMRLELYYNVLVTEYNVRFRLAHDVFLNSIPISEIRLNARTHYTSVKIARNILHTCVDAVYGENRGNAFFLFFLLLRSNRQVFFFLFLIIRVTFRIRYVIITRILHAV